ncbi:MAG TPA: NAD-dependent succinate-semialdehyde dehydrogenase [Acidimicrobiia bacterium]|nr:NAD-dependent succinate-semialdehyde dehydrogenase [Acidimicrobiia bacterium]
MAENSLLERMHKQGHDRLLIGGEWRDASDGAEIKVFDPATGEPVATVPSGSAADAAAAVDAADRVADEWAATPPRERAEMLRRSFELMTERADDLASLIVLEMGKTFAESKGEIRYAAEFYRWFSEEAVRNDGSITLAPGGDKRILSIGQPIGISLLITPWNFPAAMATRKIGPALAAGCTVILKPASDTPLTALAVAQLMEEAGVPPGVINVLPSKRSSEVVPVILGDSRVRKLSFTGSTEVGRTLLAQAAERIVSSSMELGGNAPFLVFDDADIQAAVEGAMVAKMRNGGQSCIAANRFLVHEAVADEFSTAFAEAMKAVRVGPGSDPDVDLGPLINESAQGDMSESVEMAADAGSEILVGGHAPDRPGYFFEPTVIAGVAADASILGREIFGPVAPVVSFQTEEEAISLANDTIHGLAAYLYTADLSRAMRVAEALESGMVGVNRGLISDPAAPFGGVKESGVGREGGHEGMKAFLETKYIAASW